MITAAEFWADEGVNPPLDDATLAQCERRLGVKFPPLLVTLLRAHNGGPVRDQDDLNLYGLATQPGFGTICPIAELHDEEDLDWLGEEIGDPRLILPLEGDGHVFRALNFNKRGPRAEPSVVVIDTECSDWSEASDTFAAWVEKLTAVEAGPILDWREKDALPALAEETVSVTYISPAGARETVEQRLCDGGDHYVMYRRCRGVRGEELSRTTIGKPLADLQIRPFRPEPSRTFTLDIGPKDMRSIVTVTSQRTSRGWQNTTSKGAPIYVQYESPDRFRLERLRELLYGGAPPAHVLAEEELQQRCETMSEADQRAASAHMMLQGMQHMEQLFAEDPDLAGPPPAGLAEAFKHMEALKAKMLQDLQQRTQGQAPPPEIADLIQQMLDGIERPEEPDIDLEMR
jgi:hypothetical protein